MTSVGTVTTPVVHVSHTVMYACMTLLVWYVMSITSAVGSVTSAGASSVTALRTAVTTWDPGMECVSKECEEECVDTIVYSYDGAS